MSIITEIKKSKARVFRRLYFKRRISGGNYETDWQAIPTSYVKNWGSIEYSCDEVLPYFYKNGNINLVLYNEDGYFSETTESKSFFYTAITIYRTLIKIQAGYIDDSGTEYPTSPTLFIGYLSNDITYRNDATVSMQFKPLNGILEEHYVDMVTGMGAAQTAKTAVENIRDHTQGGTAIFQQYISSSVWNITSSSITYNLATSTSLQNMNCWEFMQEMAAAENQVVYFTREGALYFIERQDTGASVFHFSGIGDADNTYGHNVMDQMQYGYNTRKIYNRVKVDWGKEETSTSRYIKQESWSWGDSSSSNYYGVKELEYSNKFMAGTGDATTTATYLYNEFKWPKEEYNFKSKFVPHLELENRVDLTYMTRRYAGNYVWDVDNWNEGYWGERYGYNIYAYKKLCRIIKIVHNLDSFFSEITLRAI